MNDQKHILAFLAMKRYSAPYNEKDLLDAIEFGKQLLTKDIEDGMIGRVVNGTMQSVLTEEKLKEILNE